MTIWYAKKWYGKWNFDYFAHIPFDYQQLQRHMVQKMARYGQIWSDQGQIWSKKWNWSSFWQVLGVRGALGRNLRGL